MYTYRTEIIVRSEIVIAAVGVVEAVETLTEFEVARLFCNIVVACDAVAVEIVVTVNTVSDGLMAIGEFLEDIEASGAVTSPLGMRRGCRFMPKFTDGEQLFGTIVTGTYTELLAVCDRWLLRGRACRSNGLGHCGR